HGIEPKVQRRRGLVKDSSRSRSQMLSASLTRPSLTLLRVLVTLKLAFRFALRTLRVNSVFRVTLAPQIIEASVIVWKLAHKFHERILRLVRLRSFRLFSVYWRHSEYMLPE